MMLRAIDRQFGRHLTFEPDFASRTVSGPDAEQITAWAKYWDGTGILYGTQPVAAPDPLGSARDMAVMLADHGLVVDAWRGLLPPADPIPDDAVA